MKKNYSSLEKLVKIDRLGKADLHIHSNYSDGKPTIPEILDYVENFTDLDIIAITDHDTTIGAQEAQKICEKKNYRFKIIVGEEISSQQGHILGLYLKKEIPAGLSARKTIKEIHAQGGVAIASHPFEHNRFNSPKMINMDGVGMATLIRERHFFDGIEIVNGTPTLNDENIRAAALNKTVLGLAETGSSDAHIVEVVGHAYTLFEGKTAKDLKKALLSRQTQAIQAHWTLLALIKYLFFFIPHGLRIVVNTLVHGRLPKRDDLV